MLNFVRSTWYSTTLSIARETLPDSCGLLRVECARDEWPMEECGTVTASLAEEHWGTFDNSEEFCAPGVGAALAQDLFLGTDDCPLARGTACSKASKHIQPGSGQPRVPFYCGIWYTAQLCFEVFCFILMHGLWSSLRIELLMWLLMALEFLDLHKQCCLCPVVLTQLQSLD